MTAKAWQLPTMETHGRIPSEDEEQIEFVRFFKRAFPDVLIYAIPNEAKRSLRERAIMKAKGLLPGMNDLCIPGWNWYLELKDQKGGDVRSKKHEVQLKVHEQLRRAGKRVDVCWGSAIAKKVALELAKNNGVKPCLSNEPSAPDFPGCGTDGAS